MSKEIMLCFHASIENRFLLSLRGWGLGGGGLPPMIIHHLTHDEPRTSLGFLEDPPHILSDDTD